MVMINSKGYLVRSWSSRGISRQVRKGQILDQAKDWWLVKQPSNGSYNSGYIGLNGVYLPKEYIGKKIRLKVELVENEPMSSYEPKESVREVLRRLEDGEKIRENEVEMENEHIYECAKCHKELLCIECSDCGFWYCKRHISLQEINQTLCDDCYIKKLAEKVTFRDNPKADEVISRLKKLDKGGASAGAL